jgi:HEAT repeat protein
MKRIGTGGPILAVVLALLPSGCGQPKPLLAGGKPVSHWLSALQDPDANVRKMAVTKLGNVGTAAPEALPAVLGALNDPHEAVRCEAILAVVKLGPAAGEAVPLLAKMKQADRNARVRSYAARALPKFQSGD